MPRHRYSNSHTPSAATVYGIDRILENTAKYKNEIKGKLHAATSVFAGTIAISGPVESALRNDGDINDPENEKMEEFMKEQRMRLKNLTDRHINR